MKRTFISLALISLFTVFPPMLLSQKSSFSGNWKLDRTKTTLATDWPVLIRIHVEFKGDTLLAERIYDTGDGQEYPISEKLSLDNKEYNIIVYEMPRKFKASLTEDETLLNFESTTTFNSSEGTADFVSKESWKVDKTTGILTIGYKNTVSGNESSGAFVFIKE